MERHDASGARIMGDVLRPIADATTVRKRGGPVLVTDGPFAETREWIAGFDILECDDLDQAIDIASQHPMARFGVSSSARSGRTGPTARACDRRWACGRQRSPGPRRRHGG